MLSSTYNYMLTIKNMGMNRIVVSTAFFITAKKDLPVWAYQNYDIQRSIVLRVVSKQRLSTDASVKCRASADFLYMLLNLVNIIQGIAPPARARHVRGLEWGYERECYIIW